MQTRAGVKKRLEVSDADGDVCGDVTVENSGEFQKFSFETPDHETFILTERNADNATELQVEVFDATGESIARGITNESVGIAFNTEAGGEYFVAVSAAEDQVGDYGMNLTVATPVEQALVVDQHVNEMGSDATELAFEENVAVASGELEVGEDRDAFPFAAPGDGEITVAMTATSDSYSTDASVTAYDDAGLAIVGGTTNDDVGIRFEVTANQPIQLLVDSTNDIPAANKKS